MTAHSSTTEDDAGTTTRRSTHGRKAWRGLLVLGLAGAAVACADANLETDPAWLAAESVPTLPTPTLPTPTSGIATSPSAATPTTTVDTQPPTSSEVEPSDDRQIAFDANITIDDLRTGWRECCPPVFAEPDLLSYNTCDDPTVAPSTAGFVREFSFEVDERGVENGHLVSQVFVSEDEADAEAKLACVPTNEYANKVVAAAEERIVAKSLVPISDLTSTYELQHLAVGEDTTVDRVLTTYAVEGGGNGWTYQDSIRSRSGRITYRLLIFTYDDALTIEELTQWASLLVE